MPDDRPLSPRARALIDEEQRRDHPTHAATARVIEKVTRQLDSLEHERMGEGGASVDSPTLLLERDQAGVDPVGPALNSLPVERMRTSYSARHLAAAAIAGAILGALVIQAAQWVRENMATEDTDVAARGG